MILEVKVFEKKVRKDHMPNTGLIRVRENNRNILP